jgi:hypothetical protein
MKYFYVQRTLYGIMQCLIENAQTWVTVITCYLSVLYIFFAVAVKKLYWET